MFCLERMDIFGSRVRFYSIGTSSYGNNIVRYLGSIPPEWKVESEEDDVTLAETLQEIRRKHATSVSHQESCVFIPF
jgi:hypothetical protein